MTRQKEPAGNSRLRRRANAVTAALAAIGGKWKLIIIYWLNEEPLLLDRMAGIQCKYDVFPTIPEPPEPVEEIRAE